MDIVYKLLHASRKTVRDHVTYACARNEKSQLTSV